MKATATMLGAVLFLAISVAPLTASAEPGSVVASLEWDDVDSIDVNPVDEDRMRKARKLRLAGNIVMSVGGGIATATAVTGAAINLSNFCLFHCSAAQIRGARAGGAVFLTGMGIGAASLITGLPMRIVANRRIGRLLASGGPTLALDSRGVTFGWRLSF